MGSDRKQQTNMSVSHGDVLPVSIFATQTLPKMLYRAAKNSTDIIIIRDGDRVDNLSYRDLLQAASCILCGLRQNGLQPQDKVILQLENPRHFFICLWACWLGGFVPVPLNVDLIVEDPGKSKLYRTWQICRRPSIVSDVEMKGNFALRQYIDFDELLNSAPDNSYYDGNLDDLALILFTSGSTGKPKGVMLSVRNLIASVYGMAKVNHLSQQDVTLNWMPLEHVASLVMFHLTEVYLGCQQIQASKEIILQNPLQWLDLIHRYRVTTTWSPNFAYNLVNKKLDDGVKHNWDLSCLRWMGNGAEAVVGKTAGRFVELLAPYGLSVDVVSPGYGMSETTSGICHSHNFDCHKERNFVSVGSPIPGVSLRIVDEENRIIPEGKTGLLQVKGETVTTGYYQQPELNREVFIDGWFNTGDLGFIEAGQLTITGRQKDVIIINGVNYYNQDIETVVESIPGVTISFTAACSVTNKQQQERVAIFFNTQEKDNLRELINQIRKAVFTEIGVSPTYIIPVNRETIPKTAIGKIMRSQLSQRFNAGEFNNVVADVEDLFNQRNLSQQDLPVNAIEQKLVAIWQEVLNLNKVGVKDNFFELGGNSLLLMQVLSKLTPEYNLSAVTLFQYPTISALANYLGNEEESVALQQGKRRGELRKTRNKDVAIIGMSCRFPGANNIDEFWHNLCNGVESISWFTDEEIINSGVDLDLISNPNYVKASPILNDIEYFDAEFWGFTPKEAQLLDPQQRLFLECAWESLEDAGYDPLTYKGDISIYGGAATNTYLLNNIYPNRDRIDERDSLQVLNLSSMGGFQVSTANDKDYLTTRTSYKLNLTGSSVNVQTACSTSLVTVHLACQSLINSECDMALAGGVSVHSPQKMGYLYQEGTIFSPDGHCRAFDADAAGTIFGSGAGMVVLKLLDKAIEEGDRIYGVIKGSAVNNDGGVKVGYLAPNVDGQTRVVAEALAVADLPADSISYLEAHGTGTLLGDPIEVKALSQAYHQGIRKAGICAMGSVKTNVGHLQMASGIVGLIKTSLCLYHQKIPASLHFNKPNPQIDFDNSPFYINTQLQQWTSNNYPRRAGVNSLGIGGTNAHVILEEFIHAKQPESELPAYLLTLSAKNETALQESISKYQDYVLANNHISIKDICFTSNVGRHHFDRRCAVVAKDKQELINKLSDISIGIRQNNKIAFLFTGQGSQYVGMAQQLYDVCDVFKDNCDRCFEILRSDIDLVGANGYSPFQQNFHMGRTQYIQPLLFAIEYSLAQMWIDWGVKPDIVMGHSIGEYVAATIAGVFDLEDALRLVSARGRLMQDLPDDGAMLAIFGMEGMDCLSQRREGAERDAEGGVRDLFDRDGVSLAADNGSHIVVSGLKEDIDRLSKELDLLGIGNKFLNVDRGFHSCLMQPIVEEFEVVANTVSYSLPKIPLVSNLTGELADESIATADYWVEHILQPVQFANSIKYLDGEQVNVFLEVGTKPTIRSMTESILDDKLCLHTLDNKREDWRNILITLAKLYVAGWDINWLKVTKDYNANKVSLPTYPFQKKRYWFDRPKHNYLKLKDTVHPLLGSVIKSPLKQTIFENCLQPDTIEWLQNHCIEDKVVFPGTAYLEQAIALGIFQFKTSRLTIKDVSIVSPLFLAEQSEIQVIASPQKECTSWEVYSLNNDEWQLHSQGEILALNKTAIAEIDLEDLRAKFNNQIAIEEYYLSFQQKGINYGKNFQGIEELYHKDKQALGSIELPSYLDSQQYHFHPALLDSCVQILFATLPTEWQNTTYIPVGLERFNLYSLPDKKVWSYLKLKLDSNSNILIADVWLYKDSGECIAKIEGLKSQAIKFRSSWHNWLYKPEWKLKPLSNQSALSKTGTWLIFADSIGIGKEVATKLKDRQHQCHLIDRNTIADSPQAFAELIQQHPNLTGVIYLWCLDSVEQDWEECKSYLYLVQASIEHASNVSVWFVTRNAQSVNRQIISSNIRNSCLWGMQKAIGLEHPELLCVGIDLDNLNSAADSIFKEICAGEKEQVAYRNDQRYVSRLVKYEKEIDNNLQLQINNPGNLDSLEWKPITRKQPQDNEIEIEIKATGLNFRDVMVALDLYPDETKFLGLECAGVVTNIGSQVDNFKVGDEVIAIADNSFSKYLNVNSLLAIHKPESLNFTEAVTIPVTFLTAYYTLVDLASLQSGEKILIHSAAGGVGIAAIQIAKNIGAEIYATASTPKWELLKSMGVTNIMNSRNIDFAESIMSVTDGKGVDVVLNSLSGEFIAQSIAVLKDNGRFVEIGKKDIWTKEDVAKVKPNISYSIVDLWQITQDNPKLIQQMLSELRSQFMANKLKPLPITTFTDDRTVDAFRYMQQGKHQGKIVIAMDDRNNIFPKGYSQINPIEAYTGTYLITGGMGAIGLQIAQWLITKGVKNIALVGRSDIKPQYQASLEKLQQEAQVICIKADISNTKQLERALETIKLTLPSLKGIIHCAGVTSDRILSQQDWNSFQEVLNPKAIGAWNLHNLTLEYDLENFIMFSSAASLIGSSGQANYCAANAFLDALAHKRRSLGLPAISINWGAWNNTGLAANSEITAGLKQKGIGAIEPSEGIRILEQLLLDNFAQVGVLPIDWNTWQKNNIATPYYEDLITTKESKNSSDYKQRLFNAIPEARKSLLINQISQQVGNILGIEDHKDIDIESGFSELGLDSLGSVELRNKLQSSYNIKLSQTVIFDYSNIRALANYLLSLLLDSESTEEEAIVKDNNLLNIENISEAEAENLLLQELNNID